MASCLDLATAHCNRRQDCALRLGRTQELAACLQAKRTACKGALEAAPGRSFADFDASAAEACVEATKTAECEALVDRVPLMPSCRSHFAAASAVGGPCIGDVDCIDGWCFQRDDGCGRCQGYRQSGETCGGADESCGTERACVRAHDNSMNCRPRRPEGHSCQWDDECSAGLFCHPTNVVCERQREPGDVCHNDPDVDDCRYDAVCISGICIAGVELDLDDLCDEPDRLCPVGTFCSNTCLAVKATGDRCVELEDDACGAAGACVDGFCRHRGSVGGPCQNGRDCRGGLTCREGECQLLGACE